MNNVKVTKPAVIVEEKPDRLIANKRQRRTKNHDSISREEEKVMQSPLGRITKAPNKSRRVVGIFDFPKIFAQQSVRFSLHCHLCVEQTMGNSPALWGQIRR